MAEFAVITAVINQVVAISANPIFEAGSRCYRLKENIDWIEQKMRHFKACLKDAESKQDGRYEVANLINDMTTLALDIQDILDTYLPEIASHKGKEPFGLFKHAACIICYGASMCSFALKIEKLRRQAQGIEAVREKCQINADRDGDSAVWDRRKKFLDDPDSMVVGREATLQELKEKLTSSNSECKLTSVVGEAGVGKTIVVKKIYREMQNRFTSSALVYVSNKPRFEELLLEIAKQVGLEEESMKKDLQNNLHSRLNKTRFLIFLDDIWTTEAWDELKKFIPINSSNQSRIVITSRYTDVGRYIGGESSLIEMKLLDQEKSWELFSKLINSSSENMNERFPSIELEDISRKIVKRCGGLPLAIVVAVGMLRKRRRNKHAWKEVIDSLSTNAENNCSKILYLSYEDLPPDFRPFFLYFGLFPKNQEILASELVKAWIAEKLIEVDGNRNPDDIVDTKLEMLSDRNLIQVSKRELDGRVKSCRIHDFLHGLCIEMAKGNNFFSTCHDKYSISFSTLRRLTIDTSQYSFSNFRTPKLRSLLYFSNPEEGWSSIPNEIGNLTRLTYLKLSGTFKRMPSNIGNLGKLVTLDIQQADFYFDLPRNIFRMKYLKHLLMRAPFFLEPDMKILHVENELHLPNIETLDGLRGCLLKPSSLRKLSNLRKLSICWASHQHIDVISGTTTIWETLQDLRVKFITSLKRLNLSHYDHLAKLYLNFVYQDPIIIYNIEFPPNLINLTLDTVIFTRDPMDVLKKLRKLEILKLKGAIFEVTQMDFSGENSFPELQVLAIMKSRYVPDLNVDQTGIPKLHKILCDYTHLRVSERLRKIMVAKL